MKTSAYISYFQTAAENHKQIKHSATEKHFFRLNIEELITGLRSEMNYPCLVLESHEGTLSDAKSDNVRDNLTGAFMILENVDTGDFDDETTKLDKCQKIGFDIISKMWKDRKIRYLSGFDPESVTYQKVDFKTNHASGYRFTFVINDLAAIQFNPNNWDNESLNDYEKPPFATVDDQGIPHYLDMGEQYVCTPVPVFAIIDEGNSTTVYSD